MVSTVRLYVDASYATAVMAFVGIVAGFATAGITGDTERSLQVALAMFALTGVVLGFGYGWAGAQSLLGSAQGTPALVAPGIPWTLFGGLLLAAGLLTIIASIAPARAVLALIRASRPASP